jgi:hypothetical protein
MGGGSFNMDDPVFGIDAVNNTIFISEAVRKTAGKISEESLTLEGIGSEDLCEYAVELML